MGSLYCNQEIVLHLEMERFIDSSLSKFGWHVSGSQVIGWIFVFFVVKVGLFSCSAY